MAHFWNQANALFHKNLVYHKRHVRSHLKVIFFPAVLFILLGVLQSYSNKAKREKQVARFPVEFPPLLQMPSPQFRAVMTDSLPFNGLPDASCRLTASCPATVLITGDNRTLGESVAEKMFTDSSEPNSTTDFRTIADGIFGTNMSYYTTYIDFLFHVRPQCSAGIPPRFSNSTAVTDLNIICVEGLNLWRNSSPDINDELFKGYREGNTEGTVNEVLAGLTIFKLNSYGVQCIFYFVFTNLQISMAFLLAAVFSNLKTASVVAYTIVFGTGILAFLLFQPLVDDVSFPRGWLIFMELYPGFSLYRGLYELSQYARGGFSVGTYGIFWEYLSNSKNGMREVLIIMSIEWMVFLIVSYYLDQVISSGSGNRRSLLFFFPKYQRKHSTSSEKPSFQSAESSIQLENNDVSEEREKVELLLGKPHSNYSAICYNLKKMYPGKDGNPNKFAVKEVTLALPRGECFGMLGPNGAGKTTFISMMTGLLEPSSGSAYVEGLNLRTQMNEIYGSMGVCPQHDLLWDTLTGREHLLFYGRLKNLKGAALSGAVEKSLKSFNLSQGGVADRLAKKYSGGMRRRLSVAISLIGDPKVVYMDEPSTGLDPASRKMLWDVVKHAKQDRAIILTTHSMDEAEYLCDRIGIFVDGNFQCLGTTDELKARYGGSYMFTMTTSPENGNEVEDLVKCLSPNVKKTYHLYGTQKFELPKDEVKLSDVFLTVRQVKERFPVQSWGLADTTLEDVFIKVASEAE
ncbi:unnamed protein product [Withania somnifera]